MNEMAERLEQARKWSALAANPELDADRAAYAIFAAPVALYGGASITMARYAAADTGSPSEDATVSCYACSEPGKWSQVLRLVGGAGEHLGWVYLYHCDAHKAAQETPFAFGCHMAHGVTNQIASPEWVVSGNAPTVSGAEP